MGGGGWVGGGPSQEIIPLRGCILQAETCQILSLAENPRWSPSVAIKINKLDFSELHTAQSQLVQFSFFF